MSVHPAHMFRFSQKMPPRDRPAMCCAYLASIAAKHCRDAAAAVDPTIREIMTARAELALAYIDRLSRNVRPVSVIEPASLDLEADQTSADLDTIPAPPPDWA